MSLFHSSITIADNGSTDATFAIARELEQEFPPVARGPSVTKGAALHVADRMVRESGRRRQLMDVDLSTNLKFYPLLIQGIAVGYDIAVGSGSCRPRR